jgi:hypothetical protein|nr:MAG TPA: hypothetical protein [Caudoviricetes sp.]
MSKKVKEIGDYEIHVWSGRDISHRTHTDFSYSLCFQGNYVIDHMSADEARGIILALQSALELNGEKEGGEQ